MIDNRLLKKGSANRNPWAHVKPLSQTQKMKAWLAIPGNQDKTSADYAESLKDNTVIQGEFNASK